MRSSWLDDQMTRRKYRLSNGLMLVVQNEYRPVPCPHCKDQQYCRLTHIWHYDAQNRCVPEYHVNFGTNLEDLKSLLITYVDGIGVNEVETKGKWILMKGDEQVGQETV